jgi:hypothetical protein
MNRILHYSIITKNKIDFNLTGKKVAMQLIVIVLGQNFFVFFYNIE